jgi:16S rRNA C1402 (ribose-2'-O) methylase RsmI
LPDENIVRGKAADVVKHFEKNPFKGEFVILVEGTSHFKIRHSKNKPAR